MNDQRHPQSVFSERAFSVRQSLAVVAPEKNDGVITQAVLCEFAENAGAFNV